jgi:hypothetical protein
LNNLDSFDENKIKCDNCRKYILKEEAARCLRGTMLFGDFVYACKDCTNTYNEILIGRPEICKITQFKMTENEQA